MDDLFKQIPWSVHKDKDVALNELNAFIERMYDILPTSKNKSTIIRLLDECRTKIIHEIEE